MRADDVIVIDGDGNAGQVEVPAPEFPPLSIKIEHEDISQDSKEPAGPVIRRRTRNRVQRQPFSPTTIKDSITRPLNSRNRGKVPGVMPPRMKNIF